LQRAIPPFETAARNTLYLSCIPVIKQKSHPPIITHLNHKTGQGNLAADMTLGFIGYGVAPKMIELVSDSFNTYSDNPSLSK